MKIGFPHFVQEELGHFQARFVRRVVFLVILLSVLENEQDISDELRVRRVLVAVESTSDGPKINRFLDLRVVIGNLTNVVGALTVLKTTEPIYFSVGLPICQSTSLDF